jgi:TrmH family RNA methyltransferase
VAAGVPAFSAADRVVDSVASTVTPQPVVAAVAWSPLAWTSEARTSHGRVPPSGAEVALVLAGVADPGNAGALLRVAEAAGIDLVVFADDAVDPGNPKVVRSAAGSLFRVPVVVAASSAEVVAGLRADGWRCVGLAGGGDVPYDEVPADGPVAVVVGAEAHGIPAPTASALDLLAAIPMAGRVESLNAAVAAGVVCFDLARRRRSRIAG